MREKVSHQKTFNTEAIIKTTEMQREGHDLLKDGGLSLIRRPKIEYTPAGYTFEKHEIALRKVLGCSIYPKV